MKSEIEENRKRVQDEIDGYFAKFALNNKIIEAERYFTSKTGKALRAFLVNKSCELFLVSKNDAMKIAIALEFVHAYSLIHDDLPCMDDSSERRGQQSLHKRFDEASALLVGNSLLTEAYFILSSQMDGILPERRLLLINYLSKCIGHFGMMEGQMIDVSLEDRILDESLFKLLNVKKTGMLFAFACSCGAIALGQDFLVFEEYGKNLGVIYQILDDICDETLPHFLQNPENAMEYARKIALETKDKILPYSKDFACFIDYLFTL